MRKELVKEFAKEHAMSSSQVRTFDEEWTETVNSIKAAGVDLGRIVLVPKKGVRYAG